MDASRNGHAILCVDDEARGLLVRKMILESQGYHVFTVENGIASCRWKLQPG